MIPEPESIIRRQTAAEMISGSSHGSSRSERSTPLSGKCLSKNTASTSPTTKVAARDTSVKMAVFTVSRPKRPEVKTST
jgi:hypothetical protein